MFPFLDEMDVKDKKLLVRVDYNVPLKNRGIVDDYRIRAGLTTLNHALDRGAGLIVCSHRGKPEGRVEPELSLKPVAEHLERLLGRPVIMAPDCVGPEVKALAENLRPGQILMLENLRFHAREEKNDPDFSRELAGLADIFVNDAFGVAHRDHASVVGVPVFSRACCGGLLLKKEWKFLSKVLKNKAHPYVAVSGGVKVSSKLGILYKLLEKVDGILIGGAMANTFLAAKGLDMGKSRVEETALEDAKAVMAEAAKKNVALYLPVDCVLGRSGDGQAVKTTAVTNVDPDLMALDIGPETVKLFANVLSKARCVIWNGPMGYFENPAFAKGSLSMAEVVAGLNALTITGGGDTGPIVRQAGLAEKYSFISTGGGSFLKFMKGVELSAFKALKECARK